MALTLPARQRIHVPEGRARSVGSLSAPRDDRQSNRRRAVGVLAFKPPGLETQTREVISGLLPTSERQGIFGSSWQTFLVFICRVLS
jgi:hypothetical protein